MAQSSRPPGQTEVLALVCSLSMITYLDRVCFGAAAPLIAEDLGLTGAADLKMAITAFSISYALFEVPSGWLGDVFGPKKTLIRIVLWWSFFTGLTAIVGWQVAGTTLAGLTTLAIVRFLFGMGEAGAYPNMARALANWFSGHDRGRAQGWLWMSGRLMGGLTPLVWTGLVAGTAYTPAVLPWRGAFVAFGVLGVAWCFLFARRFRDFPPGLDAHAQSAVSAGHSNVPWGRIVVNRNLILLCIMYACAAYAWYFNIQYLPQYLETQHGVARTSVIGSLYKGGPLLLGAAGCLIGGYVTDGLLNKTGNRRLARLLPAILGHTLCGCCFLFMPVAPSAFLAFLAISMAAFFNDLMMGAAWACCQDIGRKYTAIVSGFMNTIGNLGGAISGWTIGTLVQRQQELLKAQAVAANVEVKELDATLQASVLAPGYNWGFYTFAAVSFVAALCWIGVQPNRTVDGEAHEAAEPAA